MAHNNSRTVVVPSPPSTPVLGSPANVARSSSENGEQSTSTRMPQRRGTEQGRNSQRRKQKKIVVGDGSDWDVQVGLHYCFNNKQYADVLFQLQSPDTNQRETPTSITPKSSGSKSLKFYGHKSILSARSPYFYQLFTSQQKCKQPEGELQQENHSSLFYEEEEEFQVIRVPNCSPECFSLVLEYIYTDKVKKLPFEVEKLREILELARQYQLEPLVARLVPKCRGHSRDHAYAERKRWLSEISSSPSSPSSLLLGSSPPTFLLLSQSPLSSMAFDNSSSKTPEPKVSGSPLMVIEESEAPEGNDEEEEDNSDPFALWSSISCLFLNPLLSDIAFIVEGSYFPAHKAIVTARSSYFESLLRWNWRESNQREIVIQDQTQESFYNVLQFIYTNSLEITSIQEALEIHSLAQFFHIESMGKYVEKYITECSTIDANSVCILWNMSKELMAENLQEDCYRYFIREFGQVTQTEEFLQLGRDLFQRCLSTGEIDDEEDKVFEAVIRWAKHNYNMHSKNSNNNNNSNNSSGRGSFNDFMLDLLPPKTLFNKRIKYALLQGGFNAIDPVLSRMLGLHNQHPRN